MAKTFRPREWLPADQLAYFVSDLADQRDGAAIAAPFAL